MSILKTVSLSGFRNIIGERLELSPHLNIFFGKNGSGKTSVLEALYVLSCGRSFRAAKLDSVINLGAAEATVFVEVGDGSRLGFTRSKTGKNSLKLSGAIQSNWEAAARTIPTQVIDANSFALLEGGPKSRRQFLDWGAFHVEPEFVRSWRSFKKCLFNRNLLLKRGVRDPLEIKIWTEKFAAAAQSVDRVRAAYFDGFRENFYSVYSDLDPIFAERVKLSYSRGWLNQDHLLDVLAASYESDCRYGAAQVGPHRADLLFRIGRDSVKETLSRGQQKILVCALKIAQGRYFAESNGRECLYLVDDLPNELDADNSLKVLKKLIELKSQIFVTCVDSNDLSSALPEEHKMSLFHMEHGMITC
jgi:DNA replication and repair protein RecF